MQGSADNMSSATPFGLEEVSTRALEDTIVGFRVQGDYGLYKVSIWAPEACVGIPDQTATLSPGGLAT